MRRLLDVLSDEEKDARKRLDRIEENILFKGNELSRVVLELSKLSEQLGEKKKALVRAREEFQALQTLLDKLAAKATETIHGDLGDD